MESRATILVIDDNKATRELITETLHNEDFEVITAPGGRAGIQIAKLKHPDVILLDMKMPDFNGIQTCGVLKRHRQTSNIPVIFLTSSKSQDTVMDALKAGGNDYIVKPFEPENLINRIYTLIPDAQSKPLGTRKEKKAAPVNELEISQDPTKTGPPFKLKKTGDIMAVTILLNSMDMANYHLFRNIFNDIINEGVIKIVLDIRNVETIDGSGLGLLISLDKTLRNYQGSLRITYPTQSTFRRLSFISLNYLFKSYKNQDEAIESFITPESEDIQTTELQGHTICAACTFVNPPNYRHCGYCGSNLMLGKMDNILHVLREKISRKVFTDAQSDDILALNSIRGFIPEENPTPREFDVEITSGDSTILYKSRLVEDTDLIKHDLIKIRPPVIDSRVVVLNQGTKLILRNNRIGRRSDFESKVIAFDISNETVTVHFTEEAKILHSEKTFSIILSSSIPVKFLDPTVSGPGAFFQGTIYEISRVGMKVHSLDKIPVNHCLAIKFTLPDGNEISSPLIVAQHLDNNISYNVEFVIMDEKERSGIIQYMYQCQIEQKKYTLRNNTYE